MYGVVDKYGFVNEGKYLATILPVKEAFILFHILSRKNKGFERVDYGPLPVKYSATIDDGVVPAQTIVPSPTTRWKLQAYYLTPGDRVVGLEEIRAEIADDIFYYTNGDHLYHYLLHVRPTILRNTIFYPDGQPQSSFRDQTAMPTADFGHFNGKYEVVVLPKIHIGFQTYNPTNMNLRTYVTLYYAHYIVSVVRDEKTVRDVLRRGLVKPVTLPYNMTHENLEKTLAEYYEGALMPTKILEEAR